MDEKKIQELERQIEQFLIKDKDADDYKVWGDVFDKATLKILYKLANKGVIKAMGGVISTGKEANVFHAIGGEDEELAIKIYRMATSNFKAMQNYLLGDPRFSNVKMDKRNIVFAWTKKEFRNLMRSYEVGVLAPKPINSEKNILIMEFIGSDGIGAPRLKDIGVDLADPESNFNKIVGYISDLYNKADLVHGDLSEFNVLYTDEPVLIDMGQAVTLDHPMAEEFLKRDIKNIVRFFRKLGVKCNEEDVMDRVITEDSESVSPDENES